MSSAAHSHRVIGVFTAQLDDAYQIAVWRGIESRARQRGVGVVGFVGHRVDSPIASEAAANVAYRIADPRNVDGLVVVSSAISTFLDQQGLGRLFASHRGLPQVSVGLGVEGVPSVTADGSNGVSVVVRHLARDHGLSRFALIGGPCMRGMLLAIVVNMQPIGRGRRRVIAEEHVCRPSHALQRQAHEQQAEHQIADWNHHVGASLTNNGRDGTNHLRGRAAIMLSGNRLEADFGITYL